jgi:Zn-dependent M28 family amino/carboxypeptidase
MGLLGSDHLAEEGPGAAASTAANLNMDMLSRNGLDSLFVFAQSYSSLGEVVQGVLGKHPELGLRVRPGLQMPDLDLIRFSDQASYLKRGVPVLFFHSGLHGELHTPDDEFSLTDTEKLARAARLVFYTALAVANDPTDPLWTEEGKARADGMGRQIRR